MSQDIKYLYHQQLMHLVHNPVYKKDVRLLSECVSVKNPMCGDALTYGYYNNDICWNGEGCIICLASAEALCHEICHHDILTVCQQIDDFFKGTSDHLPEKFLPLSSVKSTPERIKCVILCVTAIRKLLTVQRA